MGDGNEVGLKQGQHLLGKGKDEEESAHVGDGGQDRA